MTPINEFLISKEMTATDLLNLSDSEESAFWDEYAAWRIDNGKDSEIAKILEEAANVG
jgi:hypothetical protein